MHALVEVNRRHVHGFFELVWIVIRDDFAAIVEQVTLAIATEDGAKVPAVTVVIGELGVVQLWIQFADAAQEFLVDPFTTYCRTLGDSCHRRP